MEGLGKQGGPGVLEQESEGARPERCVDVLVEVERGDHHDGEGVGDGRTGEGPGRLDAVDPGHPDVEEAHVGAQAPRQLDGSPAVSGLADDLDVRLGVEDHREPRADELLVVRHEDPNGQAADQVRGRTAVTVQPRSGSGPASKVPPRRPARSFMPVSP